MICKKETKVLISKKNILTERIKGKNEKKKKKNIAEASLSTQEKLRPHETFDERDVRKFFDNISYYGIVIYSTK